MRIFFVRHGQSTNNEIQQSETEACVLRQPDPVLTPEGRNQAELSSAWLFDMLVELERCDKVHQHTFPDTILTSPMLRALETCEILCKKFSDIPVVISSNLCEIGGLFCGPRIPQDSCRTSSFPDDQDHAIHSTDSSLGGQQLSEKVTGVTSSYLEKRFSTQKIVHDVKKNGWWFKQRETYNQAIMRAWKIARLLWLHALARPQSSIIVVTHGLFQDMILKTLLSSAGPTHASTHPPLDDDDDEEEEEGTREREKKRNILTLSLTSDFNTQTAFWPIFSRTSPIISPSLDDLNPWCHNVQFLCNNVGISLIELSVVASNTVQLPLLKTLNPQSSESSDDSCTDVVSDAFLLKLGILFWNQSFFLPQSLRLKSGHAVSNFSIF